MVEPDLEIVLKDDTGALSAPDMAFAEERAKSEIDNLSSEDDLIVRLAPTPLKSRSLLGEGGQCAIRQQYANFLCFH